MTTPILELLGDPANKGQLLELVVLDLLADLNFTGIRRQLSGSQFGFDLLAYKVSTSDGHHEVWKFECKNLNRAVTVKDVAPKLIWTWTRSTLDYYVIVAPFEPSNELIHLLSEHPFPMPVVLWTGSTLADLILSSPAARRRLGVPLSEPMPSTRTSPIIYHPVSASLDVVHQLDPPAAFDYLLLDDAVTKAYTDHWFRLYVTITNRASMPLDIHQLAVHTVYHSAITGRVLRQSKPKGVFEPLKLVFRPSVTIGSSMDLLAGRIWRVEPKQSEVLALELEDDTVPGYYELVFAATGTSDGKPVRLASPCFPLHKAGSNTDLLVLHVIGRHYDSPAEPILRLDANVWKIIKDEVTQPNQAVYLGSTHYEQLSHQTPSTWRLLKVSAEPFEQAGVPSISINPRIPSTVVYDLGLPIDEELYSVDVARARVFGTESWQGLFDAQVNRRAKIDYA